MSKTNEEILLEEFEKMLEESYIFHTFNPDLLSIKELIQKYHQSSEWTKNNILKKYKLPKSFVSYIIKNEVNEIFLNSLAENPFLSSYYLKQILKLNIKNLEFTIGSHQNCDSFCQKWIISNSNWANVGQVASNPSTILKNLKLIYSLYRNHSLVLSALATNPNLDISLIEKLAKTYNRKIVLNLLENNEKIPTKILWNLENLFSEKFILKKIQKHPNYNKFASIILEKFND